MTEKGTIAAIMAGLAYTGVTRRELAKKMGMHYDTLNRKLRMEQHFDLPELEAADRAVKWSAHIGGRQ